MIVFTREEQDYIAQLYNTRTVTVEGIAMQFFVSRATIYRVLAANGVVAHSKRSVDACRVRWLYSYFGNIHAVAREMHVGEYKIRNVLNK